MCVNYCADNADNDGNIVHTVPRMDDFPTSSRGWRAERSPAPASAIQKHRHRCYIADIVIYTRCSFCYEPIRRNAY